LVRGYAHVGLLLSVFIVTLPLDTLAGLGWNFGYSPTFVSGHWTSTFDDNSRMGSFFHLNSLVKIWLTITHLKTQMQYLKISLWKSCDSENCNEATVRRVIWPVFCYNFFFLCCKQDGVVRTGGYEGHGVGWRVFV